MKQQKTTILLSKIYIIFSILSLAYVSLMSLINPQATMDLISTSLDNTDAISSIRGIYGGVGLVITVSLIYLLTTDPFKALIFLACFWYAYAMFRLITIWVDGPLGDFGSQWLVIESSMSLIAVAFIFYLRKKDKELVDS